MASSREDNSLQLPSWDEFDAGGEQLDYEEDGGDDPGDPIGGPSCSSSQLVGPSIPIQPTPNGGDATSSSRSIGPALPPGFDPVQYVDDEDPEDPEDPDDPGMERVIVDNATPELAPTLPSVIGPSLPYDEISRRRHNDDYGPPPEPSIPRDVPSTSSSSSIPTLNIGVIGPAIPPDLLPFEANGNQEDEENDEGGEEEEEEDAYGPAPPPMLRVAGVNGNVDRNVAHREMEMPTEEGSDDDEMVGPMPARQDEDEERELARRKAALEAIKASQEKKVKREEWMLELPKKLNNYGLGPRVFSKVNGPTGDNSAWTKTPNENGKEDQPGTSKEVFDQKANAERDEKQGRLAKELNGGRTESLLDSHSRKRKVDESGGSNEEETNGGRRPFDREKDMQVRGLRSASTSEIKEKCGQLNSRFGNSSSQKFL